MKRIEDQICAIVVDVSEGDMSAIYSHLKRADDYWMELTLSMYEMELLSHAFADNAEAFTPEFIDYVEPILLGGEDVGAIYFEMKEGA